MYRNLLLLLLIFVCAPAFGGKTVIQDVHVINMVTGEVAARQAVLVENGRISAISEAAPEHEAGVEFIDGQGGWLMPGLAEMHAHVPSWERSEQSAKDVLALFLANGVTTIRGMLGEPSHLELRETLASGAVTGPRLITSGPSFNGRSVTSPEQGAARVREQVAAGYDFLKIHPGLSREEFLAIAAAARQAEIPFAGHISHATGLHTALSAGQASIDHLDSYAQAMLPPGSPLQGEAPSWFGMNLAAGLDATLAAGLARETAQAGVWNVPTQSLFETTSGQATLEELISRPGMNMLSNELAGRWKASVKDLRSRASTTERQQFLQARRTLIAELQAAGAGLLLGSDAPQIMNVPGFSVHQELAYLVDAGLTPLQALQSGTINVAAFFGFQDQGTIAAGQVADLLLLRGNPLLDIDNSSAIIGVMRAGRWYDRQDLDQMLADVEKRGL